MIKPRNNNLNIEKELTNYNDMRVIVFESDNTLFFFVLKDNRIKHYYAHNLNSVNTGDIYTGIVKKVNKATQSYFISISEKETAFLPGEEITEKVVLCDEKEYKGKLCEGMQLLVEIKKMPYKEKRATCTAKLSQKHNSETIEGFRHNIKYTRVYEGDSFYKWLLNKYINFTTICSNQKAYEYCRKVLAESNYSDISNPDVIRLYDDLSISLVSLYGLKGKFENITLEKVWLKNGGSIVINQTEAMHVIDVNSGKSDGHADKERSILETNLDAVKEICSQIEARNLSGIIIIDFINLKDKNSKTILIEQLSDELDKLDPPGKLVDITKLGLAEITRAKKRPDIYELQRCNNINILRF